MDPLTIANGALSFANEAFEIAAKLFGTPAWEKYVLAGIAICQQAIPIIEDCTTNPAKYDNMTPADIRALLAPESWDDLVKEAAA
ncbi:MAG: hypothetical protein ABSD47_01180 [Candidatus Methylomirabilota bacterium]|jgi:hypothetical protein